MPLDSEINRLTPRSINVIRARLRAYHRHQSATASGFSWTSVADEILSCPATRVHHPEDEPEVEDCPKADSHWPIKGESLRRFAEAITKRPQESATLPAIIAFLRHKGFLTEADLLDTAGGEPHYVHCPLARAFGRQCGETAQNAAEAYRGEYRSVSRDEAMIVETTLTLTPTPRGDALEALETSYLYRRRGREPLSHLEARFGRNELDERVARAGSGAFGCRDGLAICLPETSIADRHVPGSVYLVREVEYSPRSDGATAASSVGSFALIGDAPFSSDDQADFARVDGVDVIARIRRLSAATSRQS